MSTYYIRYNVNGTEQQEKLDAPSQHHAKKLIESKYPNSKVTFTGGSGGGGGKPSWYKG